MPDASIAAGALNIYLLQEFILTDEVYHNTLGERLAYDRIERMLDGQQRYVWIAYAFGGVSKVRMAT